jgi:hypothetical protein
MIHTRLISNGLIAAALGFVLFSVPALTPTIRADEQIPPVTPPNDCICDYGTPCPSGRKYTCASSFYCENCACVDLELGDWTCV